MSFLFRLASVWALISRHRMAGWLASSLILAVVMALSFGQLRAVFGFKTLLVIWGAYLGYWISRGVLRDYRPDYFITEYRVGFLGGKDEDIEGAEAVSMPNAVAFAAALLARAVIVAAVIFALALGA